MHPGLRPLPGIVLVLYGLNAAPNVCYVVNDALTPADILPGVTVPGCSVNAYRAPAAQGSIISIIGENLGPSVEEAVAGFPIRTNLNGASVQLQVGSVSVNALM